MNGKPKTWKEPIKTNLYGQDVLYAMYYRATAMWKVYLKNFKTQEMCNKAASEDPYLLEFVTDTFKT